MSLIIPVYRNAANITSLLAALDDLHATMRGRLEVVFVVDGSPDDSYERLAIALPGCAFPAMLLRLSRNFGSFSAIRAGLGVARGDYAAVMAADLQEPPSLIAEFYDKLRAGDADVVIGKRRSREDPGAAKASSSLFWWFYRRFVMPELPEGGVDIFGCTRQVRDEILRLREVNSSLVGLLFWVGFRRSFVEYDRREREIGKSGWTFRKKLRYLNDSVFSFSDLPIQVLLYVGIFGLIASFGLGVMTAIARFTGAIAVPGYAATILVLVFFGALNCFGLGIIGGYVWRTFENTKGRPNFIVDRQELFAGVEREAGIQQAQERVLSH